MWVPSSTRTRGAVAHTIQCANGTCCHALGAPSRSARQKWGSRLGSDTALSVSVQDPPEAGGVGSEPDKEALR